MLYSQWRSVPLATRAAIAAKVGISRVGPTHVVDNRIESDGYRFEDIENALTVESMQKLTGSTSTDPQALWTLLVEQAEGHNVQPAELLPRVVIEEDAPVEAPKKKAAKKATKKK